MLASKLIIGALVFLPMLQQDLESEVETNAVATFAVPAEWTKEDVDGLLESRQLTAYRLPWAGAVLTLSDNWELHTEVRGISWNALYEAVWVSEDGNAWLWLVVQKKYPDWSNADLWRSGESREADQWSRIPAPRLTGRCRHEVLRMNGSLNGVLLILARQSPDEETDKQVTAEFEAIRKSLSAVPEL